MRENPLSCRLALDNAQSRLMDIADRLHKLEGMLPPVDCHVQLPNSILMLVAIDAAVAELIASIAPNNN